MDDIKSRIPEDTDEFVKFASSLMKQGLVEEWIVHIAQSDYRNGKREIARDMLLDGIQYTINHKS